MKDTKTMYAASTEAKRIPHVQGELAELDKACARLAEQSQRLEGALSGVLREAIPDNVPPGKATEQIVPIAAQIRECTMRIANTTAFIESIISRLEV